jgi:hypothetical protein
MGGRRGRKQQIEGSIDQLQQFNVENSKGMFGCKYVFQDKKNGHNQNAILHFSASLLA